MSSYNANMYLVVHIVETAGRSPQDEFRNRLKTLGLLRYVCNRSSLEELLLQVVLTRVHDDLQTILHLSRHGMQRL